MAAFAYRVMATPSGNSAAEETTEPPGAPGSDATVAPQARPAEVPAGGMKAPDRAEIEKLKRRTVMISRGPQIAPNQVAELETQLMSVRAARDAANAQVQQLTNRLEVAERRVEEGVIQRECLERSADLAHAVAQSAQQECDELRKLLRIKDRDLTEAMAKLGATAVQPEESGGETQAHERLKCELVDARKKLLTLDDYIERLQKDHREASATLTERLARTERERNTAEQESDRARQQLQDFMAESEAGRKELADYRTRVAELQAQISSARSGTRRTNESQHLRQEIAELTAQLEAARDELRVAWALAEGSPGGVPKAAPEATPAVPAPSAVSKPPPARVQAPLGGAESQRALGRMRGTLAAAAGSSVEALDVLQRQVKEFAERSLSAGSMATYRVMSLCTEVVQWMRSTPSKMEAMREPLQDAFTLLSAVAGCADAKVHADTTESSVYVIDDDVDNCECIATALNKQGVCARYAAKPRLAIEQLTTQPCHLIIIDADVGNSSDELHLQIRALPHHQNTPVLFLTGAPAGSEQSPKLANDKDGMLAKPYSLAALGLKALHLIMTARLVPKTGLKMEMPAA